MIKKFFRSVGILAIAGFLLAPLATTASAQSPIGIPEPGGSYSTTEAFILIQHILILERQKATADIALESASARIAKQDALLAAKAAEIKKIEAALGTATGKAKVALEKKIRAARFEWIKLESGYRSLTIQYTTAKMQVTILANQIATQKAALAKLTAGSCTVNNAGFSCVL